jgi:hypothetical protein
MKGTKPLTPTERKLSYLEKVRANGGRALHVYLNAEATAALAKLREGGSTSNDIVSEALVAYAREYPPDA